MDGLGGAPHHSVAFGNKTTSATKPPQKEEDLPHENPTVNAVAAVSQKGRFSREPRHGRRIELDPREKVSQNSFSFLISQKAVGPMSYEWRRSRDLSNGSARIPRRSQGSAFRANVSVSTEPFKLLARTAKRCVKTAESGNERLLAFCGNCGAPIYACAPAAPASYSLRIGTIEQRAASAPGRQTLRRSALPWVDALASAPATEKE